jgi:hypothetical protein
MPESKKENILSKWKLIHPVLLAFFPGLVYYASNSSEALLHNIISPVAITLVCVLVMWGMLYLLTKERARSALITSVFLIWFVSSQHISKILRDAYSIKDQHVFIGYIALGIGLAVFFAVKRLSPRLLDRLSGFLTIVGVYFIVSSIARVIPIEVERAKAQVTIQVTQDKGVARELQDSLKKQPPEKPDIYYIVPDRYARQDILQEFYHFDNSTFIQALEDRGFYVASQSSANYPKTFLSLASSLNLRHLDALPMVVGENSSDNTPVFQMVQNNMVATYLKDQGYRFVYSGDWWEPTRVNRLADRNINLYADSDEFLRKYGETTILNPIFNHIFRKGDILGFSDNRVRDNHLYKFKELKKVVYDPSPKFVLVHMLMPHSPYVLDAQCQPFWSKSDHKDPQEYVEQLQCANTQLLEIIDSILTHSKTPPVIIIQSDEGPFKVDEMNKHGEGIDWTKVSTGALRHHMHIINAYYVPAWKDNPEAVLYPKITPVNTFRLLFNTYFGTNFAALEDRIFMIPHLNYPYKYIDITDILVQ